MKKLLLVLACSLFFLMSYSQVLSPVFNDARLLSKRQFKAGIGYSALGFALKSDRTGYLNSIDVQGSYGLSEVVNLGLRYQQSWYASEMFQEWAASYLFASANISLKKGRISLLLPLGTRFTSVSEDRPYFEFSPTLLFTIPVTPQISFNPAVELGFPFCEYCTTSFLSADLGVGITPTENLTFFAEYDLVYAFKDFGTGHYYMFNAGISYKFAGEE